MRYKIQLVGPQDPTSGLLGGAEIMWPSQYWYARIITIATLFLLLVTTSSGVRAEQTREASMTGLKTRIETVRFKESIDFYTRQLGMTVLDSWDQAGDRGAILGFSSPTAGEAFLELAYVENPKNYDGLSLQFRVNDIAEVVRKLRGKIEFTGPTSRPWGSEYLYLKDPTGISIIIYEGEL